MKQKLIDINYLIKKNKIYLRKKNDKKCLAIYYCKSKDTNKIIKYYEGILDSFNVHFKEREISNLSTIKVVNKIKSDNKNNEINGIIIFRPIKEKFNWKTITAIIDKNKDVDGLNKKSKYYPGVCLAIFEIIKFIKIDKNENLLIINKSDFFGKPLKKYLLKNKYTNVKTYNSTNQITRNVINKNKLIIYAPNNKLKKLTFNCNWITNQNIIIDLTTSQILSNQLKNSKTVVINNSNGLGKLSILKLIKNIFN